MMTTEPARTTDRDLARDRERDGRCGECGVLRKESLTMSETVRNGRCLIRNPIFSDGFDDPDLSTPTEDLSYSFVAEMIRCGEEYTCREHPVPSAPPMEEAWTVICGRECVCEGENEDGESEWHFVSVAEVSGPDLALPSFESSSTPDNLSWMFIRDSSTDPHPDENQMPNSDSCIRTSTYLERKIDRKGTLPRMLLILRRCKHRDEIKEEDMMNSIELRKLPVEELD